MYNFDDNVQLDENVKLVILNLENDLDSKDNELKSKDSEIQSKDNEINKLKTEVEYLKSIILNKNRKIFGKSSERFDFSQVDLFNEAEVNSDPKNEEPEKEEIKYTRNIPSKKNGKKDNSAHLERVVIHHQLEDDKLNCPNCSSALVCIGKVTKEILKFEPAKLYVEEHITHRYACEERCENEDEKTSIVSAKAPNTLLQKSMASNEILSHVISLKYLYALPLDRQESYFKMLGLSLSKQTLSNWIIAAANKFKPVYEIMHKVLLKGNYVQADETTLTLLDKSGDESRTNHYMWLYRTGTNMEPVILYEYQPTRSGSNPRNFLEGFKGYLQTDGYSGYNSVNDVEIIYCLAHIRRKFHDIIKPLSEEARKTSVAYEAFMFCEKLYEIEKDLRKEHIGGKDYFKIRYETRLKKSAPVIDKFIEFLNVKTPNSLGGSALGKALVYAKNHMPSFKIFLKDGSFEIDNNAAERAIKPFVIGRKNWLFCKNKNGAESSSIIYSIIETAKANNLMVEKYLLFLIDKLSNLETEDTLLEVMPWSKTLPEDLSVHSKK